MQSKKISSRSGKLDTSAVGKIISGMELPRISQEESDGRIASGEMRKIISSTGKPAPYIQRFVYSVVFLYYEAKSYLSGILSGLPKVLLYLMLESKIEPQLISSINRTVFLVLCVIPVS